MFSLIVLCTISHTPQLIPVDRDNVEITQSCTIKVAANPIIDADGNGVIHITQDGITVDFANERLHGANVDHPPNAYSGTGITIAAKNVTLRHVNVSGFKIGIHAINADGLTIHHCDVSNNFHQRLKSTPTAEDASDWLWPHHNDNHEWITNYGAGLCVENSNNVTIHTIRARKTQNGIILDRVNDSKVYDCDCSFLSGWGLAMWRSNRNVISRNAFDFCVRGYSHGVYNRGQDSAGILMFEQCSQNVIAENSATHCGDGFFGFAGKEALGDVNTPHNAEWYQSRGCNGNVFVRNDFSYAPAHGLEITFSFGNYISDNVFRENAICGIWGGYSSHLIIIDNTLEANGDMAYGQERGGINIEHGSSNSVCFNRFSKNTCGVRLWWDNDEAIFRLPWYKANRTVQEQVGSISFNAFENQAIAIELALRESEQLDVLHNVYTDVQKDLVNSNQSRLNIQNASDPIDRPADEFKQQLTAGVQAVAQGESKVGTRKYLAGRENIIMTEWGPWDHESPLLQFVQDFDHADEYNIRGTRNMPAPETIQINGEVFVDVHENLIRVRPKVQNALAHYQISFEVDGHPLSASGTLAGGTWRIQSFASSVDPREKPDQWRTDGLAAAHEMTIDQLDLHFGHGGLTELCNLSIKLPSNHFGTIATRSLTFPTGTWRIKTLSDDGIRVWLDDQLVIDDWTWHAPKEHTHEFTIDTPREIKLRVEHFELDGFAVLSLDVEPSN